MAAEVPAAVFERGSIHVRATRRRAIVHQRCSLTSTAAVKAPTAAARVLVTNALLGKATLNSLSEVNVSSELVRASFGLSSTGQNDKIHILPAGPVVVARDERIFQVTDLSAVIGASEVDRGLLIDWEHNSEKWDGSTEAAGWVTALEMSDGTERAPGLWGTVKWTPRGKADIDSGSYRFLSPVLLMDSETREVTQILSVALTNKPALRMAAVGSSYRAQVREACAMRETSTQRPVVTIHPSSLQLGLERHRARQAEPTSAAFKRRTMERCNMTEGEFDAAQAFIAARDYGDAR